MDNINISSVKPIDIAIYLSTGVILEVSAYPKPGNVHRLRNFSDIIYEDFLLTGLIFIPQLIKAFKRGKLENSRVFVGDLIYNTVRKSMLYHGGGNTCLGTAILLLPVAASIGYLKYKKMGNIDIGHITRNASLILREKSTIDDTIFLYRAIRAIRPSYIKKYDDTGKYPSVYSEEFKEIILVNGITMWDVLRSSSKRDIISGEVIHGYPLTNKALKFLIENMVAGVSWNYSVINTYLYILSHAKDTIVIRKFGIDKMIEIAEKARDILEKGGVEAEVGYRKTVELDKELAKDGINPGSSADITALVIGLYALKRGYKILRKINY